MNLGISQLAFNNLEDLKIGIELLQKHDIQNLEVVYSKMESDPIEYTSLLFNEKIRTESTQSILFGSEVKDFLDPSFVEHIKKIIETNQFFKIKVSVLGSPKQRVNYKENELINQFKIIDSFLIKSNQILCIEPNCKNYGGSYFFTIEEIVNFIKKGEFVNIKTMLDTHNVINEGQSPNAIYSQYQDLIHHIHVSENGLLDFEESDEHLELSKSLKGNNFEGIITYEVLPSENLDRSLEKFKKIYQ